MMLFSGSKGATYLDPHAVGSKSPDDIGTALLTQSLAATFSPVLGEPLPENLSTLLGQLEANAGANTAALPPSPEGNVVEFARAMAARKRSEGS